jgi:hypothetical protein
VSVPEETQGFPVETAGQAIPEQRERAEPTEETVRPVLLGAMARMGETGQLDNPESLVATEETEQTEL